MDEQPNLPATERSLRRAQDAEATSLASLIVQIAGGDRQAFAQTYRRTSAKLFGVCLRILAVRSDAEEVLQEVYLAVWRKAGTFDEDRGSAMTWLLTLARNRSLDRVRSRGNTRPTLPKLAEVAPDAALGPAELLEASDDERRLADCMARLKTSDATSIRTAFFEGVTYVDLAARAGLPLGTLKSRIRRALLQLRECLE